MDIKRFDELYVEHVEKVMRNPSVQKLAIKDFHVFIEILDNALDDFERALIDEGGMENE